MSNTIRANPILGFSNASVVLPRLRYSEEVRDRPHGWDLISLYQLTHFIILGQVSLWHRGLASVFLIASLRGFRIGFNRILERRRRWFCGSDYCLPRSYIRADLRSFLSVMASEIFCEFLAIFLYLNFSELTQL